MDASSPYILHFAVRGLGNIRLQCNGTRALDNIIFNGISF